MKKKTKKTTTPATRKATKPKRHLRLAAHPATPQQVEEEMIFSLVATGYATNRVHAFTFYNSLAHVNVLRGVVGILAAIPDANSYRWALKAFFLLLREKADNEQERLHEARIGGVFRRTDS